MGSADGDPYQLKDDDPAFADKLDIDAVRAHVNSQVQQSDRPADFKRAIELLTELDRICTDAWYRRHPEPWGHDDWAHVSSEIEALHSGVGAAGKQLMSFFGKVLLSKSHQPLSADRLMTVRGMTNLVMTTKKKRFTRALKWTIGCVAPTK